MGLAPLAGTNALSSKSIDREGVINLLAQQYADKNGREGVSGYTAHLKTLSTPELFTLLRETVPNKSTKSSGPGAKQDGRPVAEQIVALEGKPVGSPEAAARLAELQAVSPKQLLEQLEALKDQIAANPAAVLGQSPTAEQKAYALESMRATVLSALQQEHGTASPSGKRTGEESAQFKADVAAVNAMSEDELKAAFAKAQQDLQNTGLASFRYTGGLRPV